MQEDKSLNCYHSAHSSLSDSGWVPGLNEMSVGAEFPWRGSITHICRVAISGNLETKEMTCIAL